MKSPSVKNKKPEFEVYARIVTIVSCKVIDVDTLEEAMEYARTLKANDFLTVNDDCEHQDDSCVITSVCDSDLNYNSEQRP